MYVLQEDVRICSSYLAKRVVRETVHAKHRKGFGTQLFCWRLLSMLISVGCPAKKRLLERAVIQQAAESVAVSSLGCDILWQIQWNGNVACIRKTIVKKHRLTFCRDYLNLREWTTASKVFQPLQHSPFGTKPGGTTSVCFFQLSQPCWICQVGPNRTNRIL